MNDEDITIDVWRSWPTDGRIAMRIIHIPTGFVVYSDGSDKSAYQAKKRLLAELGRKVAMQALDEAIDKLSSLDLGEPSAHTPRSVHREQ